MKVRLVDMKTNLKPTVIKRMLRGLMDYIIPMDIIISKKRLDDLALADIITKTKIVIITEM